MKTLDEFEKTIAMLRKKFEKGQAILNKLPKELQDKLDSMEMYVSYSGEIAIRIPWDTKTADSLIKKMVQAGMILSGEIVSEEFLMRTFYFNKEDRYSLYLSPIRVTMDANMEGSTCKITPQVITKEVTIYQINCGENV